MSGPNLLSTIPWGINRKSYATDQGDLFHSHSISRMIFSTERKFYFTFSEKPLRPQLLLPKLKVSFLFLFFITIYRRRRFFYKMYFWILPIWLIFEQLADLWLLNKVDKLSTSFSFIVFHSTLLFMSSTF